jgi:hypothetical protein
MVHLVGADFETYPRELCTGLHVPNYGLWLCSLPSVPGRGSVPPGRATGSFCKFLRNMFVVIMILIPCIIDYVAINQLNALKLYTLLFPTCFGKTNIYLLYDVIVFRLSPTI